MLGKIIDFVGGTGSTVAASTTTLITSTPPNSVNTLAIIYVLATCPSSEDRAAWYQVAFAHKSAAGVFTLDKIGDIISAFATNPIKHASIAIVISGGTIELQVTGDASGPPIEWEAYVYYIRS